MMSGKAIARAIRAIIMIASALRAVMMAEIYGAEPNPSFDSEGECSLFFLDDCDPELLDLINFLNESANEEDYMDQPSVYTMVAKISEFRAMHTGPTAETWFTFLDMEEVNLFNSNKVKKRKQKIADSAT